MYEDEFYINDNIIGYTGNLYMNPTVYFQKGFKFGRITQEHSDLTNIGRNKVRTRIDYKIINSADGKAREFYDGKYQHTSRNRFIPVDNVSKPILAKAISRFPNLKPR